jgi:hypothetical protein
MTREPSSAGQMPSFARRLSELVLELLPARVAKLRD